MGQFHNGFVGCNLLRFQRFPSYTRLQGEVGCLGNIVITVLKVLEHVGIEAGEPVVRTKWYSYHAKILNGRNLFRYDNEHARSDHVDNHHKHNFHEDGTATAVWIGADRWPTLAEVIREAEVWYYDNRDALQLPEIYPPVEKLKWKPPMRRIYENP